MRAAISSSSSSLAILAAAAAAASAEIWGGGPFVYAGGFRAVENGSKLLAPPPKPGSGVLPLLIPGRPLAGQLDGRGDAAAGKPNGLATSWWGFKPAANMAAVAVLLNKGFCSIPPWGPLCLGSWPWGLTSILLKGMPLVTVVIKVFLSDISSLRVRTCLSRFARFLIVMENR